MWRVKTAFGAGVLLFVIGGAAYVQAQYAAGRERALRELSAIAELREDQISAWCAAQIRAGAGLMARPRLRDDLLRFIDKPSDEESLREVMASLTAFLPYSGFADASIIGPDGRTLRRLTAESEATAPELEAAIAESWRLAQPALSEMYPAPAGAGMRLAVAVPFIGGDGGRAAIALECDPGAELYPILQSWPLQTKSAESYLIGRRGDVATILSPLRHIDGGGVGLELPLARKAVAAVHAALGEYGVKRGLDYRDVMVFSASVAVSGSPWVVVAEIDEAEAMAGVRRESAAALALVLAILTALLAAGAALWVFALKARFAAMYEAEHAIARSSRLYAMLSQTNLLLTRSPDRTELLEGVCRIAVERGGFLFAWYGELTPGGAVRPVYRAGEDGGYIDHIDATVDERSDHGAGPTAQSLRRAEHVICNDFLADPATAPWHAIARQAGIRASAAFPVREDGRVVGAFGFYSAEKGFFTEADIATLDEMASDVSFGFDNLRRDRERGEALDALAELKGRLDRYLSVSPVINYVLNVSGDSFTPHWVSENIREFLGFEPAEALQPNWWNDHLHPDDRDEAHRTMEALFTTDVLQREYRFLRKNGGVLWVLDVLRLVRDESGAPVEAVGAWSDVTLRKRAEEALRLRSASLEAVANAVTITDAAGRIEWVNPAFTELTGYALEECIGRRPREVVRREGYSDSFFEDIWAIIRAGRVWRGEIVNRAKDGRLFTVEATITPVKDDKGRTTHFIAVEQDITDRKRLEEEFRQAQKMESIGRLAGGVAHDFNNLLSVISGYAEMAVASLDESAPVQNDLAEIRKATERAANLTRQLLAFSRRQVLRPAALDISDSIRNLEKMVRRLLGANIALDVHLACDLGPVLVDPGQFEQVMMNLLVNARDAMPEGGRITVRTGDAPPCDDSGAAFIRITVADTGVGMDDELQRRIFEPFFTTKEEGKGTGLGLSTVYGIVQQSGGRIEVQSAPGKGTVFLVDLPRYCGSESSHVGPVAPAKAAPAKGTESILLVEDEEALRRLAQRTLESAGYRVYAAADAAEAAVIFDRCGGDLDLLLTDVMLPGVSGPKLAVELIARRPGLKAVFMSGYTDDSLNESGPFHPGENLVNKPFTRAELTQAIRNALEERK